MDTKTLIADAKARFNHNSAKSYLAEKYNNKLLIAEQGGLWKADAQTISLLASLPNDQAVLIDTFDNPVQVNRTELLNKLTELYDSAMNAWYTEWKELEGNR
jgi:hypothetical protein